MELVLATLLHELQTPLRDLIEREVVPKTTLTESSTITQACGVGMAMNYAGNLQLGGEGAQLTCDPATGSVAVNANEMQVHGALRCFAASAQRTMEVNTGPLNGALLPPVDPFVSGRFAPARALVTVPVPVSGPSDTPAPAQVPYVLVNGTPMPVLGIGFDYLFGYNRSFAWLEATEGDVYRDLLGG